jgi:hypothetical protein
MAEPSGWMKEWLVEPVAKVWQVVNTLLTTINDLKDMKETNKELRKEVIELQKQAAKAGEQVIALTRIIDRLEKDLPDKIELEVRREVEKRCKND